MKVLLVGHALGPGLGSEPGNTWNFAWHLSGAHEVTLLSHPQHRTRVDEELAKNPRPNLKIHWVTLNEKMDPWNPEKSEKGLKLHYLMWQREAARQFWMALLAISLAGSMSSAMRRCLMPVSRSMRLGEPR